MQKIIDLSGEWGLTLDKACEKKLPNPEDVIVLPNSVSHAHKGEYNHKRETGFLTDTYSFEGNAWFSKDITLPDLKGFKTCLFLERTRLTRLYIDGKEVGNKESLCAPHIYDVSKFVSEGSHRLDICVSNKGYKTAGGHLTSPDTQTNWNGIVGKIELHAVSGSSLKDVMIYPDIKNKAVRIKAVVVGDESGKISVSAESLNTALKHFIKPQTYEYSHNKPDIIFHLGKTALLWDEHSPNLYKITLTIEDNKYEYTVGLRDFKTDKNKFIVNGKKTFLRGKHDGMIFPETGFAPMDKSSWLRVMGIAKSYGINHYRFHTCCPPEAAFEAADILGIYLEPELPFWGTVTAEQDQNHNPIEQQFLIDEGFRILKTYGNHPSLCMMSLGNELWGSKQKLNEILGKYKEYDNRRLYTQGSNNFQWYPCVLENDDFFVGVRLSKDRLLRGSYAMCDAPQGHVQTNKPSANFSYDNAVVRKTKSYKSSTQQIKIQYKTEVKTINAHSVDSDFLPEIPIVTHEIGQYEIFPDFNQIQKYTGSIKAKNLEIFRERLIEKGMLEQAEDFFISSGMLAVNCYKQELEAAFRSKSIAGFQLLDIQDFSGQGTALVGILDAFMDSKGLISPEKWRGFCSSCVLTANFDSYIYEENQVFSADISLTYYGADTPNGKKLSWKLSDSRNNIISQGQHPIIVSEDENYIHICNISLTLPSYKSPEALTLELESKELCTKNSYELYVYPKISLPDLNNYYVFSELDIHAKKALSEGKRILVIRNPLSIKNSVKGCYCTDFWCYPMFKSISQSMNKPEPIGTMGLLIQNNHPSLSKFPCRKYTTPQWWEIVVNSCSEILDNSYENKNIIIQTIDNFDRNHRLGLLYEQKISSGTALICSCDLKKLCESPEGRQFLYSLICYIDKKQ